MGEVGENKEEKKEEAPAAEEPTEVVLKIDMHCEGCARRVEKCLRKLEGVEKVIADSHSKTVVVKGKVAAADPTRVCERVKRKIRKKPELISPLPKPPEEVKPEENKEVQEEKKEEPPKAITVILKVRMHCEACAQVIQKRIKKIEGVELVVTDVPNAQVIVRGIVDPNSLVDCIYRKTKKQASIVQEEEKEEDQKPPEPTAVEEKKEEEKKEGVENNDDGEARKYEYYWPFRYYVEHAYMPQMFNMPQPQMFSVPQTFSDENLNACSVM